MNKAKSNKKIIIFLAIAAIVIFGITFLIISLAGRDDSSNTMSPEKANSQLEKMLNKVDVSETQARKAAIEYESSDLKEELPDISKYPLKVQGGAPVDIEIFASIEKASSGMDGWINEVAEKFNKANLQTNGQQISVSIRSIPSGVAADYIISGKHVPDAFSPSNELWGKMVEAESNSTIELKKDRLIGNVTGVVMTKSKADQLKEKYGEINIDSIITATEENELIMGYTNPFASSTGLNFLIGTLYASDPENPLSDKAISRFEKFQANIPFVAYTTLQMRDAAIKQNGALNAMVLEYQTYKNTPELRGYEFIPFGVRHDSPMYAIGNLTPDKSDALNQFIDFCLNAESQQLGKKYGFNENDSYSNSIEVPSGDLIATAQRVWKEKKDAGRPVAAVFVADISGSMSGEPINNLRKSLINASQYINSENMIGLVSYDSEVYVNLPLAVFDLNQRASFIGAVEDLNPNGATATFDAVLVGLDMLNKVKADNPQTKTMLFVLSDGETNSGHTLKKISGVVEALDVPIYTIGYNANLEELQKISTLNEAASINADSDDVVYALKNLFNAQM